MWLRKMKMTMWNWRKKVGRVGVEAKIVVVVSI